MIAKDFGFNSVHFNVPVTPEQKKVLYENLSLICHHIGLEGDERRLLGEGTVLTFRNGLEGGNAGGAGIRNGELYIDLLPQYIGNINFLAHEIFHLFDARIHRQETGRENFATDKRKRLVMFSDQAASFPSSPLAREIVAIVGNKRDIVAQAKRDLAEFNKTLYPNPVERFFSFSFAHLTEPPYFREATEQMARAFAWEVSGQNPFPDKKYKGTLHPFDYNESRLNPFAYIDREEKLQEIAPLALQLVRKACGKGASLEAKPPGQPRAANRKILVPSF